jgi:LysR family transcriptional regulator, regulator for bpeEF and oprC
MLDLRAVAIFVKVAERRSFSRAARELGITQSGASNAIVRLEDRLGLRLLARTTRRVGLTEDGAAFFERCRRILADLEEAEQVLTQARIEPVGSLRIDLPVVFGRLKVVPLLGAFRAQFPQLELEVSFTDRFVDLVEEGVDAAVRVGELRDSSLIARRLTESPLRVVGAPRFLAEHGTPHTIEDLDPKLCLPHALRDSRVVRDWHFKRDGKPISFAPKGPLTITDGMAVVTAAAQGYGLAQVNDYTTDDAVAAGTLLPLLQEFTPPPLPIWLVYSQTRHLSPKVRAFVDFMVGAFR